MASRMVRSWIQALLLGCISSRSECGDPGSASHRSTDVWMCDEPGVIALGAADSWRPLICGTTVGIGLILGCSAVESGRARFSRLVEA